MVKAYLWEPIFLSRGLKLLSGRFELSDATPPGSTQKGLGFVVTRIAAGRYEVTMNDPYYDLNAVHAHLVQAGAGVGNVVNVDVSNFANKKFQIWISISNTGVVNDITGNPNFFVEFTMILKNSTAD